MSDTLTTKVLRDAMRRIRDTAEACTSCELAGIWQDAVAVLDATKNSAGALGGEA